MHGEIIMSEKQFECYKNTFFESLNTNELLAHPNYNLIFRLFGDETKPETVTTITFGQPLKKIKEKREQD